ncbi:MAG TPA: PA2169 family four-helix-bundle protein [Pyrinomonadaceae bacterium]|jgi:uncharacterized protein (TIGR02284 family)
MSDHGQVLSTLNELIETCKDGQEGFRQAAEGVKNGELKTLFLTYAQQRAQFAGELQAEVRRLGGDPETTASTVGALHRGWMNLKAALAGADEGAIISECERGEDAAVSAYESALTAGLPQDVREIVARQAAQVREAHDRIRALERASGRGA